jgi:hypothetical protein
VLLSGCLCVRDDFALLIVNCSIIWHQIYIDEKMPSVIFLHLSLCFGIFNLSDCFGSTLPNKGAHECAHKLPKGIWLSFDFADSHPVSWFLNS